MIELKFLRILDAFARTGSLSAAAEELHSSQPALSRAMKQMEDELGVPLFHRGKNKLTLTETGQEAARSAKRVLDGAEEFERHVRSFNQSLHTIAISYCAPAPQLVITPLLGNLYGGQRISSVITDDAHFLDDLHEESCDLIVTHYAPKAPDVMYKKIGSETIFLNVDPSHPLAFQPRLHFHDLDGMAILLRNRLGFWHTVVTQNIHNPRFLMQVDPAAFKELAFHSHYPFFTSTYTEHIMKLPSGRVNLPFSDPECSADYYLAFLKKNENRFRLLWKHVNEHTIE